MSAKLDDSARREVEDHVDDCDDCRKLLVALVRSEPPKRTRWHAGDRVGRYVVGESVGRGAMGEVFRGDDTELGRPVALKRLHANVAGAGHPQIRSRLVREARAAAQLQHPNVVAVYEIVDDHGSAVLATEWIDGVTLREWLTADRSWREIVRVVGGAGRGLAAAHAAGIVHRDFKPENVLVDREGRARVADFGLASGFDTVESIGSRAGGDARVTVTGTLAGTPAYMAPELIDGAKPDARSDQFAFAVTLFEAVYGRYPYAGTTAEAIWAAMATNQIAKGSPLRKGVPAWLDKALRRGLAANPQDRFADLAALLDLIERRSSRGMGVPLAAAGAVGGIAVAGLLMMLSSSDSKAPCGDELVDDVWSQPARDAYARQFASVSPRAKTALAIVDPSLEQWTGAWRLGRRAACTAEPKERRARTACLDRQLVDLRAQLRVFARADAAVVDRAVAAVGALPSPDECTTAVTTSAVAKQDASLADSTADIVALTRAGRFAEARPKAKALAEAAPQAADPTTKARAMLAAAHVEYELRDGVAARAHLAVGAQLARKAGDDALLAEILVLDASVHVINDKPSEALGVLSAVEALSPRGVLAAKVWSVRGDALSTLGRGEESIAAFAKAVEILEVEAKRDPIQHQKLAANIGAYGSAMGRFGNPAEGIVHMKRALAMEKEILGSDHAEVARTLHDLAYLQQEVGDVETSIANYDRARSIFVAALGQDSLEVAACDAAVADILIRAGELERAYQLATRARSEYINAKAPAGLISSIETALGNIEQNRDRCAAAIPHYERALVASKEAGEKGSALAIAYANLASCLGDVRGRDAEARNALEAALGAWDSDPKAGPERAHALATLADLEARRGRFTRAIELGEQALATVKGLEGELWDAITEHVTDSMPYWRRKRAAP